MGCVGVALLAAPLLLTMQFAALSNRPEVTIQSSLEGSLYPANFASLAVANVFGSLTSTQDYWGPNYDTLPEVGATDRSFNYLFVGVAPTIVLLWFGVAGGLLARRDNRLMAGVLLVAVLYTWAATRRSTAWLSTTCRASTCSDARSTAVSCW